MTLDKEVEIVADVLMRGMFAVHELPLDFDLQQKYRELAVSAIDAMRPTNNDFFERGKDIGRMIGWDAAKRDTGAMLDKILPIK